ncbi:MAG: cobalt ECF transporter T component CbiQ [Thermodesulfobacteriota bacterium]
MHLETLAHGDSLFHRLDPRAKLMAALAFSLAVALARQWPAPALGLALAAAGAAAARLDARELAKRLIAVNGFTALLWVLLPWQITAGADPLGLGLAWSPAGLALALLITLKANAIVLGLTLLLATSPMNHIFHALAHWRVSPRLLQIFFFFYRYLHVLHQEWHRLFLGLRARGFRPRSSLHTYRTYAYLLGNLLLRSLDRAQRVYQAMLCRGFKGTYWLLDHFHWRRRDSLFLAVAGLAVAVLAGLEALAWS